MSEVKTPKWYQDYPDWKRVLHYWKQGLHRTGLTIQSIASITGGDGAEILRAMKADPKVYVQWCTGVQAPVWSIRTADGGGSGEQTEHLYRLSHWSLKYFPPGEFKALERMKGYADWKMPTGAPEQLKKAARGALYASSAGGF